MEETKKCPYCGEEVLAVAKKCKHCGEWFSNAENETVHKPQIECPVCAELVEVDTEICPHCHERISGAAPISPSVVSPQKKKMILEGQTNGFFEYYFADVFVHHYADFKGKISRKQFCAYRQLSASVSRVADLEGRRRRIDAFADLLCLLSAHWESLPAGLHRDALERRLHFLTIDYLRQMRRLRCPLSDVRLRLRRLHTCGLLPLPARSYGWKYLLVRWMTRML